MIWKLRKTVRVSMQDLVTIAETILRVRRKAVSLQNDLDVIIHLCDGYFEQVKEQMETLKKG
ncbi:MAG: hypothetical protein MJZ82_03095 [Paludibacteraceae bacterium]|nr:hypothetical protein [Paludibacteraceae bacterium]